MATDQQTYERVFAAAIARKVGRHGGSRHEYRCLSCGSPATGETPPARCPDCGDVWWHLLVAPADVPAAVR